MQDLNSTAKSLTCAPVGARLYYVFPDHLGTPRLITDEQSTVVWRNLPNTESFGTTPPQDDPNATGTHFQMPLAFPGQYRDTESGLVYNVNRDYDPSTGRYVQSDPIGLRGEVNTYGYVNGNPVSYADPDGKAPKAPWPWPVNGLGQELVPSRGGLVSMFL
jgi:RHS repeat-associated protein